MSLEIPVIKDYKTNEAAPWTYDWSNMGTVLTKGQTGAFVLGKDDKTIVLISSESDSAGGVRIKTGDGIQGVNDLEIAFAKNSSASITPEAGRFKQHHGSDKGKVVIECIAGSVRIIVFEAP